MPILIVIGNNPSRLGLFLVQGGQTNVTIYKAIVINVFSDVLLFRDLCMRLGCCGNHAFGSASESPC